ncbi:MAG TPA: GNAT family N-acetyltransferase [Burkholderiaceae bacterium]
MSTNQAGVAEALGDVLRFPAHIAPFYAVAEHGMTPSQPALLDGQQPVFLEAVPRMPPGWRELRRAGVLQMVHDGRTLDDAARDGILTMGAEDVPDMQALTALVYPAYFREGTASLGRYVGLREQGRLIAMAGERMHPAGYREISGICTHPDHTGRGHARALTVALMRHIAATGDTPFLHVDAANARARALYEKLGFVPRRELTLVQFGQ